MVASHVDDVAEMELAMTADDSTNHNIDNHDGFQS